MRRYGSRVSERALIVSLHDVSPLTYVACARIVPELEALGVGRISLLVIPDHHHRGHFAADSEFCDWLRSQSAKGHEIVTHGYYHRRERRRKESAAERLTTLVYTAGEGEFFDIDREQARTRVKRANEELRGAGMSPRGFIAPAWLLGAEAESALRELGCEYTTRLRGVSDLRKGCTYASQSLCWSVRAGWRRLVSRIWNRLLFRRLASNPLLRVAIHPVDIRHSVIWTQIVGLISRALRTRIATTYYEWVVRQRALDSHGASSQSCRT
jgi:predicted deacetylase